MRLASRKLLIGFAAVLSVFAVASLSASAQNADPVRLNPSMTSTAGLILQEYEGELRMRRPRATNEPVAAPSFRIKVDRKFGASTSFFMGMEDIAPGDKIRLHHHPHAEEILFVHRGTGIVRLGAREVTVRAGATVYIPRNVSVGLRNTGDEPLSLVFIFSEPDGMSGQMRSGSVGEGEPLLPFTPEELAARNARAGEHIIFDEPNTPR